MAEDELKLDWTLKKLDKPAGSWEITIEICNLTAKERRVHYVDNPWNEKNGGRGDKYYTNDQDFEGKEKPGSGWSKAWDAGKSFTLKPKGQKPDDCRKVSIVYPFQPYEAYTDIYDDPPIYDPKNGPQAIPGGAGIYVFPKQAVWLPPGRHQQYLAVSFPLPYPMWAEVAMQGKHIEVAITAVKGLPHGWHLAGTLPALGQSVRLDSGDRASSAAILLEQRAALPPGETFRVEVHQRIVKPHELAEAATRVVYIDVIGRENPGEVRSLG